MIYFQIFTTFRYKSLKNSKILAIKNPNFSIWWSLPDDATRAEILATYISNFLVCGAICGSAFQLPKEHLSEIPIVYS